MGRKSTNPVSELYFTYDIQKDVSTCKIENCRRPLLKGRHSNNLETHIKCHHDKEYKVLQRIKSENVLQEKRQLDDANVELPSLKVINYIFK